MPRIFVSYSRSDESFARELATALSNLGADVWIDIEDIPAGMKWSTAIQQGLDTCDALLVNSFSFGGLNSSIVFRPFDA